jgi:hypothetical protein
VQILAVPSLRFARACLPFELPPDAPHTRPNRFVLFVSFVVQPARPILTRCLSKVA